VNKTEKFNYCVGHYWPDWNGQIGTYTYGGDVFFGTLKDARNFRAYVESKKPDEKYHIFRLVEVG
jgi:hypothetical protein